MTEQNFIVASVIQKLIKLIEEHGESNRFFTSDFGPHISPLQVAMVFTKHANRVDSDPRLANLRIVYCPRKNAANPAMILVSKKAG